MRRLSRKHELINIQSLDDSELKLPDIGFLKFHDAESEKSFWIDTSDKKNRYDFSGFIKQKSLNFQIFCKKNNVEIKNIKGRTSKIIDGVLSKAKNIG